MKNRKRGVWLLAAIFAITTSLNLFSTSIARAEDEKQKQDTKLYELEIMTVTAQKRKENVQDVPIGMKVFSDIQIEDTGIKNILDLTNFVPNVSMNTSFVENIIVIRGISSYHTSLGSPAGFYVDDVCYPHNYMHNTELLDIERAEVLMGPQGTLYGRNSESGVVNIITRQPDDEFKGKAFAEYGNYNSLRVGANISGPLAPEKLYLGISVQSKTSDGYITNVFNDDDKCAEIDHKNGRATLRWTPTDAWDLSLIGDAMKNDDQYGVYRLLNDPAVDWHEINQDVTDQPYEQEGNGQTLRVKYGGAAFDFLSVSGTNYYKNKYTTDFDQSAMPGGTFNSDLDNRMFSQEFRLSSPRGGGPFQWLVGLYGFKEETNTKLDMEDVFGPGTGSAWNPDTEIDSKGYAAFGQTTYTLFDRLHLTAGLRFDHQSLKGKQVNEKTAMAGGVPATLTFEDDLDYNEILPKFALAYDWTDSVMTYATVTKGYLTGGYNWAAVMSQPGFTFDPEYSWNYEIGAKSAWWDNKVIANAAFFYIDVDDKQVSETDPNGLSPLATRTVNAGKTHSLGFEADVRARPVKGLELFGGLGYVESKVDEWVATEFDWNTFQYVTTNYEDKDLPHVPKYTYNLGVQYRHENGFFGRIDLLGTGRFYSDAKNTNKQDAYELVNLRAGYESKHFDLVLWCENLFDKEYTLDPGMIAAIDGKPLTLGITLTGRF